MVMPALRDRQGDMPLLVDEFLKRYNAAFQKDILGIAPECVSVLENYDWPGNVRELKNVVQRAVLVCADTVIASRHLPPRLMPEKTHRPTVTFEVGTPMADVEREMIVQALSFTGNNRKRAAEILGISRRALYNKLKRHCIG
jgi:two-component system NtrC family response regulator